VAKLKGAAGAHVLAGTVQIDPRFLVATRAAVVFKRGGGSVLAVGGGNLITNDGAGVTGGDGHPLITNDGAGLVGNDGNSIVGPDGGGLITNDGGGLITNDGGGLITNDGAGFAAPDGNTLIGQDGASLITNDGGGLISNDGGGLVSTGSGSLVSTGSGSLGAKPVAFRLVTDEPAPLPPDLPPALPAAGMWVGARSLRNGKPVPVGLDPAGKPVYTVFSNAEGKFQLFLDPALVESVRLVAAVPGANEARHFYNLITPAGGDATVGEDKALATSFVRFVLSRWLVNLMAGRSDFVFEDISPATRKLLPPEVLDRAKAVVDTMSDVARKLNIYAYGNRPDLQRRVALLFADRLLLEQDVTIEGAPVPPLQGPAIDAMIATFQALNQRATALPGAQVEALPFMVEVNRGRLARKLPPYRIVRASDVADVLMEEYLASDDQKVQGRIADAFAQLDLDPAKGRQLVETGKAISASLANRMMNGKVGAETLDARAAAILLEYGPGILKE
jgi:hypothetical protein